MNEDRLSGELDLEVPASPGTPSNFDTSFVLRDEYVFFE